MKDEGVFAVHRGVFDHPIFAPEPYTEREAWLWLISNAVWKAARVRAGRRLFQLQRGQLVYSERFLAEKWKWSKTSVRRFLERLRGDAMLALEADRDATLITICNYDRYAFDGTAKKTADGPPADRSRTKEEEGNNSRKITDDAEPARSPSLISPEAIDLADKLTVIAGHDLKFVPPGWCGAAMRVQAWLADWPREIIIAAVTATANRKRGPPANRPEYFEPAIAEEFARQSAPLPKAEIREAPTVVAYGKPQKTESLSHVARRHAEAGISFGEKPTTPSLCVIPSGSDVRLLPQGGSERSGDLRGGDGGGPERISAGGD